MTVRALPATLPLRPTSTDTTLAAAMTSGNSKPSVFTTTTCEFLLLPANATAATVAGINLPLPKPVVNRVVVLGDTGCRISIGNVYQACGDPTIWPFSVISSAAAAMKPDLVLHVGDYQYRDNPCPSRQHRLHRDALGLRLGHLGCGSLHAGEAATPRQPPGSWSVATTRPATAPARAGTGTSTRTRTTRRA